MQNLHSTLYLKNGSSDKVYQVALKQAEAGFLVEFAFGRRGTTLKTGTKTQQPVPYEEAKHLYDQLLKEKTGKGYSTGEDGIPYVRTEHEGRISGVQCQLLNPIDESELETFLDSSEWCFQEKFDGKRLLIRRTATGAIEGINRKGLIVGLPASVATALAGITTSFILDGESVGDTFFVFDILHYADEDLREQPYAVRLEALQRLAVHLNETGVEIVPTALSHSEKTGLLARLKAGGKEGLVVKRLQARYAGGRPASGGDQLKFKFTETVSALVIGINHRRSVSLGLFNENGILVEAGNVTILPNFSIPDINQVVEVRYLYAQQPSGKLYQPVYLGERTDIDPEACRVSQLKYKTPLDEDDNG
ncbi:MAG: WGR domain-containing protein [Blastocatellia bacterium]|nr:WGR domain-containing protein [Blastocatellia bacterium]